VRVGNHDMALRFAARLPPALLSGSIFPSLPPSLFPTNMRVWRRSPAQLANIPMF